ncbi:hypothetical protein K7432_003380 [Basidiobolus ranarum]|uniref:OsmC-like protein n=1 Tax=Basidiobolus ranarum TaxID=34480 RepID=A0ABR2WZW2_9FUNG
MLSSRPLITKATSNHKLYTRSAIFIPRASFSTRVVVTTYNGYRQEAQIDKHRLTIDEPVDVGGTDAGPDPISTVASALGGCTNITLQMYAKRKKYPLEKVITSVHTLKNSDAGNATAFHRTIQLVGEELKPEHRESLLNIANKCPVHRILENSTKIVTELV